MARRTSTGSRRSRLRLGAVLAAIAVGIVAALAGAAFADQSQADNDIGAPGNQNTIAKTADPGTTVTATAQIVVNYLGSKHLTDPQSVTFSKTSTTLPAGASVGDATVSIPSDWGTTTLATGTSAISFTAPSTPGDYSYTVTYDAAGYTCTSTPCLSGSPSFTINLHVNTPTVTETTAPSVVIALNSPNSGTPDGSNGWFKTGPVTGTVTATDTDDNVASIDCTLTDNSDSSSSTLTLTNASGIGTSGTASGDFSIGNDGNYTISCTATDSNDNTTDPPVTQDVKLDTVAPTITDTGFVSGTAGTNSWYVSAVTNGFSATDGTSGLADCAASFTKSSGTSEGSSVKINSGSCSDNAGNTNSGIDSIAYKIDLSDPTNVAFVGGPADGGSYYFGSVPAAPTCTADDAVSGLAGCVVTGYSGAVGAHTLTATATDNAGRTATATRNYTVLAWTLNGFYQPVDMSGTTTVWNTVKNGSTVPLKFEVFAGPTELTDTSDVKSLTYKGVSCSNDPTDAVETTATGGTSLRYDTTAGQFVYNWQTPKTPGACLQVTMTTQDLSTLSAYFKLK